MEVQLYLPLLLPMLSLHPSSGSVYFDAGGVDVYGYGFLFLVEALVWINGEGEDAFFET